MSPYRRNVIVGLTVLIAMLILGWMILQFGGTLALPFTPKQLSFRAISDRADGISDGSPVVYRGVQVGRVDAVSRGEDMVTVYIDVLVDAAPPLPANIDAKIRTQGLIGAGAALVLETVGGAKPEGTLQVGAQITAKFVGLDILPPELMQLASELRETVRQFRDSKIIENLNEQITKAGKVIDSTDSLLNDPKLREDLHASLANLRDITSRAKAVSGNLEKFTENLNQLSTEAKDGIAQARATISKTEGHIDDIARQLNDRLAQASTLLEQFQSIAGKIDKGEGTAGRFINDPRLYESLAATAAELTLAIKDAKRLIQQLEEEGFSFKMK